MSKNIEEIYEAYTIPPWLRTHMYRVAAVAATLFDARVAIGETLSNRDALISACLLHDMGNIIKFNFDLLSLFNPAERDHWEKVKKEMIEKYGPNEHTATGTIVDEIGVSQETREIITGVEFIQGETIEKSGTLYQKIFLYADSRVVPTGIGSLQDRFADAHVRYEHLYFGNEEKVRRAEQAIFAIEKSLFSGLATLPEDISDTSTEDIRIRLQSFSIC